MKTRQTFLSAAALVIAVTSMAFAIPMSASAQDHRDGPERHDDGGHPQAPDHAPAQQGHPQTPSHESAPQRPQEPNHAPAPQGHPQTPSHAPAQGHPQMPPTHTPSPPGRAPMPRAESSGSYHFRDQDRQELKQHYQKSFAKVNRTHRPDFHPGAPIAAAYRPYITPVPADVRRGLPPPPSGYQIGYYQGYSVVYNPVSYVILSVLDLLN